MRALQNERLPSETSYTLNLGKSDDERLLISNSIYGPSTYEFLNSIQIKEGMTVIDIGCGTGNVTCWLAEKVGPHGKVIAVDMSEEQLAVAKEKAAAKNLFNIEYIQSSLPDLKNVPTNVDIVYCRFVLVHVTEPLKCIQAMARKLKPDGILCCEEPTTRTHSCYPLNQSFIRADELTRELGKLRGVDYDLGEKLYHLFNDCQFQNIVIRFAQPAIIDPLQTKIFALSFDQLSTQIINAKLATADDVQKISQDLWAMTAPSSQYLVSGFRKSQIIGRGFGLFDKSTPNVKPEIAPSALKDTTVVNLVYGRK